MITNYYPKNTFWVLLFMVSSILTLGQTTLTYSYTGNIQTFTVPAGVTSISVKLWGAGGGGSYSSGGSGAFLKGTMAVIPGQTYRIVVGGGGFYGITTHSGGFGGGGTGEAYGGSGGGYSGIFLSSVSQSNARAVAAGGGGAGYNTYGGSGGVATGQDAENNINANWTGGSGGTPTSGGLGGQVGNSNIGTSGGNGSALNGGAGGNEFYGGGGGGGGYFGGGGGYGCKNSSRYSSGGGGGSSYTTGLTSIVNLSVTTNSNGTVTQAPGGSESEYIAGIGNGGDGSRSISGSSGGHGLVIISYMVPNDAGITSISNLSCPGIQNVVATIKNYGTANLTSAIINWSVNGVAQAPYSWTGNLVKNATAAISLGNYNFSGSVDYIISASTSLPNGVPEIYTANDGFTTPVIQTNTGSEGVIIANSDALICKNTVQTLKAIGGDIRGIKYTLSSGTLNKTIPDNSATGVFHDFLVTGLPSGVTITRVDVKFNVNHANIQDLELNLQSPNGKIVNLVANRGGAGANYMNTIATSNTTAVSFSSGSAPYTGTFKADLSAQTGLIGTINTRDFSDLFTIANGTWKLLVYDDSPLVVGTLVNCEITITYDVPSAVTWSASSSTPNTIFMDSACTIPYVSGSYASTVYVRPAGNTTYTATSSYGTCSKSSSVNFSTETAVWDGALWSVAPAANRAIEFKGNYSTSGTKLQGCSCIVTSGNVTISSGDKLTLQDELQVNGGSIVIESNAGLFQTNKDAVNKGNIIVKRNANMKRGEYIYWSSPVSGQNLKLFSSGTLDSRFYVYNESNNYFDGVFAYVNYPGFSTANAFPLQNKSTYNFDIAKGYGIRAPNTYPTVLTSQDWVFTGVPNNGTQTISVTRSATGSGYNLVGNPYPSNISFKDFYNANSSVINNIAFLWTNTNPNPPIQQGTSYSGNNYATLSSVGGVPAMNSTVVPTDEISVGQGFIVQKTSLGTSSLSFTNSMRKDNPAIFFNARKSEVAQSSKYWLKLTTPVKNFNTLLVGYVEGASNGFDEGFDLEPMAQTSDMFYSIQDNKNLIIQGRSSQFSTQDVVPLGAVFYESGNYEIAISKLEGVFNEGQQVYLRDNDLNKVVNLSASAYTFYANAGVANKRFEIVYVPQSILGTKEEVKNQLRVYQSDDLIHVIFPENMSKVTISDASGKVVYQQKVKGRSLQIDASDLEKEMYFVTIETPKGTFTKKIVKK